MEGGSCFGFPDGLEYAVTVNTETGEIDCSGIPDSESCLKDMCIVDATYVNLINTHLDNDPDWFPHEGTVAMCPKCSTCTNNNNNQVTTSSNNNANNNGQTTTPNPNSNQNISGNGNGFRPVCVGTAPNLTIVKQAFR